MSTMVAGYRSNWDRFLALWATVLLVGAACSSGTPVGTTCGMEIPAAGASTPVGDTGIVLRVPAGWQLTQAGGADSIEVAAASKEDNLRVGVLVAGLDALPFPGPNVVGSREVQLSGLDSVQADQIREDGRIGLRYVRPWKAEAFEVRAEADPTTCEAVLEELLRLVDVP